MTALKYWDGSTWQTMPAIQGPPGPTGPQGIPGGTMGASHAFYGLACTVLANTWKVATPTLWVTDGDATNFSIVGNEVVVRDAGVYYVAAQGRAPLNSTRALINVLVNDVAALGQSDEGAPTGLQPTAQMVLPLKLPAGARVRVEFYAQTAGAFIDAGLAITRQGGPKGDPGAPGAAMQWSAFSAGAGAAVSVTSAWKAIPIGSGASDPVGAFTVNADNSISVPSNGWYSVSAKFQGPWGTAAALLGSFTLNSISEQYSGSTLGSGSGGPYLLAAHTIYMTTSDRLYFCAYSGGATQNVSLAFVSIVRQGGPTGPKGDPGGVANQIPTAFTMTSGYAALRTFNPASYTSDDLARVIGTLIDDMKAAGLMKP